MVENQLEQYCKFLDDLTQKLDKFFSQQEPYICCKEGCSFCCEKGEYPCSELEFSLLKLGFDSLDNNMKSIVVEKINKLKEEKLTHPNENLKCECPFLINNRCSVYLYRPIVCRTFGIPYFQGDTLKVPFCHNLGLNYSQVYDEEKNILSAEKVEQLGYEQEPLAYNLSLDFLINRLGKQFYNLDFGEIKTIPDWMINLVE